MESNQNFTYKKNTRLQQKLPMDGRNRKI